MGRREDVTAVELIGGIEQRELFLVEYDDDWPARFTRHETRLRAALGSRLLDVQHIGSTAVPGLAAKPIIDILVTVTDITDENAYLTPMIAAGYPLRVREPGHRMVRTPERDVHIHILEPQDPAVDDYLVLRDHLRVDHRDRQLYEDTKRRLLARTWDDMNAYADAKTEVIEAIKARARSRRGT